MAEKHIHILTKENEFEDICNMLQIAMSVVNNPCHSFTYKFNKCSYLKNYSVAIIGVVANFVENLHKEKTKEFLDKTPKLELIQNAILMALKENEIQELISKETKTIYERNNNKKIEEIRLEVIKSIINLIEKLPHVMNSFINAYIHQQVENIGSLFDVNSMTNQLRGQLIYCNFLSHFIAEYKSPYPEGKYIGFRVHKYNKKEEDNERIVEHIKNEWLTDEKVKMSPALKEDIVSRIFELYQNAFGHGVKNAPTPIDVISCGAFDEDKETISLCIVDLGGGICKNVRNFVSKNPHLQNEVIDNISALKWALKRGNTTKTDSIVDDMPRGVGLDLLKEFVHLNKGRLEIYTNDCRAFINKIGEYEIAPLNFDFTGTLAMITINCNQEVFYLYQDEENQSYF